MKARKPKMPSSQLEQIDEDIITIILPTIMGQ